MPLRLCPQRLSAHRIDRIRHYTWGENADFSIRNNRAKLAILAVHPSDEVRVGDHSSPDRRCRALRQRLELEWFMTQLNVALLHGGKACFEGRRVHMAGKISPDGSRVNCDPSDSAVPMPRVECHCK